MKTPATPRRFESAGSRVAVLQHEPQTGLGIFSGLLDKAGVDYEVLETGGAAPLPEIACFDGAIVLGGSLGAHEPSLLEAERWIREAVQRGTPLLGLASEVSCWLERSAASSSADLAPRWASSTSS